MSARTFFGILLLVIGGGLLLDRAGVIAFGQLAATWWPLIIILIAAVQILFRTAPLVGSLILLGVGLVFQGITLELLPGNIWRLLWPLALVAIGLWLVLGRGWSGRTMVESENTLSSFVAFGGANPRVVADRFEGGSVTTIFGSTEIDMRDAQLSPQGAVLDITAAFSSVELVVPAEWHVQVTGLPLFGGWENKTRFAGEKTAETPALKVTAFAAFAGIEVHN